MCECEREEKSVLGEADGVNDSGFVRWTKIYFSPIELWKDRAGREGKGKEGETQCGKCSLKKDGEYGEYMYIVPSRRERIRERIGWTQTEKMY